ncbi:MAG: hypothetical protein ACK55Z_18550, partial [bacterium]
ICSPLSRSFFSFLHTAVEASFDIKKAHGKLYTPPIRGGRISSFVLGLAALWGPSPRSDLSAQWGAGPQPLEAPLHLLPCPGRSAAPSGVRCPPPLASQTSWASRVSFIPQAVLRLLWALPPLP